MIGTREREAPMTTDWNHDMDAAPREGTRMLAVVDGDVRVCAWGKTSHVPLYGWLLVDQGAEDADLCAPASWMPMPLPDPPKESE